MKALPREKRRIGALPAACLGPKNNGSNASSILPLGRVWYMHFDLEECPTYGWTQFGPSESVLRDWNCRCSTKRSQCACLRQSARSKNNRGRCCRLSRTACPKDTLSAPACRIAFPWVSRVGSIWSDHGNAMPERMNVTRRSLMMLDMFDMF